LRLFGEEGEVTVAEAILWAFRVKGSQLWGRFVCQGCNTASIRMVSPDGRRMLNGRGEDLGAWDDDAKAKERCVDCWHLAVLGRPRPDRDIIDHLLGL
jgi:hypothetical protein